MGREAVEAAQELVWAKNDKKRVERVINDKIVRLVKVDMEGVMDVLVRGGEGEAAVKVFEIIRKEPWYKPDSSVYGKLIYCLGKGQKQSLAVRLLREMKDQNCDADETIYASIISSYCEENMYKEGLTLLREMQSLGMRPYDSTFRLIIGACKRVGEDEEGEILEEEREKLANSTKEESEPLKSERISRRFSK